MRDQPCYRLTTDLSLVVVATDRDEALAKALCMNALVKDQINVKNYQEIVNSES